MRSLVLSWVRLFEYMWDSFREMVSKFVVLGVRLS